MINSFQAPDLRVAAISPDQQILVDQNGGFLQLPNLHGPSPFVVDGQSVRQRFEAAIKDQLALHGKLLAILDTGISQVPPLLILAYASRDIGVASELDRRGLRWRKIDSLHDSYGTPVHLALERAGHLAIVHQIGIDIVTTWSHRFALALSFLEQRVAEVDVLYGWTQLLTGNNIGALSTAQGILSYVHAGAYTHIADRAQKTILSLQNPDGGWPVRRALIGQSDRSITESTLYCLWALTASGIDTADIL
ncbi:hypothetical protein [Candidatus Thiodictyon syntrophicum]|uniref:hypothetical protein n=1 Tax=Candidatus Thiodictyon syntrophicum TaxID=1166950 RepID=UPI0012FE5474|nr:hypothetical protein [Candidatus Thiodictyon syntrophicum]